MVGFKTFELKGRLGKIEYECDDDDCFASQKKDFVTIGKAVEKSLVNGKALHSDGVCSIRITDVEVGFVENKRMTIEGQFNATMDGEPFVWGEFDGKGNEVGRNGIDITELSAYMENADLARMVRFCKSEPKINQSKRRD